MTTFSGPHTSPNRPNTDQTGASAATTNGQGSSPLEPLPAKVAWETNEYPAVLREEWAAKFRSWGISPEIAAERRYSVIYAEEAVATLKKRGINATTKQGKRLKASLTGPGPVALMLPWYSLPTAPDKPTETRLEMRPLDPARGDPEQELVGSAGTPVGTHPAVPADWRQSAPRIVIVVGMINADAVLTAYLHSLGFGAYRLDTGKSGGSQERLGSFMASIPAEKRVLILSAAALAGAADSFGRLSNVNMKDREAWIVTDMVSAGAPFAYRELTALQAQLMKSKGLSNVGFMIHSRTANGGGEDGSLTALATFLGAGGTWEDLEGSSAPALPTLSPQELDARAGDWRIHSSGTFTEEFGSLGDGSGGSVHATQHWKAVLALGGRVLTMLTSRAPSEHEIRTGRIDPGASRQVGTEHSVQVELGWSESGEDYSAIVSAPKAILNYPPHEWDRVGATIPDEVLLHPSWPPIKKMGEKWLVALKGNRRHDVEQQIRWTQMGWVPTDSGVPAFIVGDQVVADPATAALVRPGVTGSELAVAPSFGIGEAQRIDWNDAHDCEYVIEDFRAVMSAYVDADTWTDPSTSALVLATALRPVIPIRPKTTIYIWGPKGKGKSWTARAMMYFWARDRTDWQDRLPGSALDTGAFIEKAVSQAPIWVVDDLAPTTSRQQAQTGTAKLEDLTRNIFNNAAKGRMNADMSSKRANKPIAQLIVTAENELTTPSAKERLIPISITNGKLNPDRRTTDRINEMAAEEGIQARFTGHMIGFVQMQGATADGGWEGYRTALTGKYRSLQKEALEFMEKLGSSPAACQRASGLAADILLSVAVLQDMALALGMEESFVARFGAQGMRRSVFELVHSSHMDNQDAAPGRSLLRALSSLLASGQAHIISAIDPSKPPVQAGETHGPMANHQLGWSPRGGRSQEENLSPGGLNIGTLVYKKNPATKEERPVVYFDRETAFKAAQDAYPNLVPYGQSAATGWAGIWDEGLAPEFLTRNNRTKGRLGDTNKTRIGSSGSITGCPVDLDVTLNAGTPDDPEEGQAE